LDTAGEKAESRFSIAAMLCNDDDECTTTSSIN